MTRRLRLTLGGVGVGWPVRLMTTSHVEAEAGNPFLAGQGWGLRPGTFHGSVGWRSTPPPNGWVGGTGAAGYVVPSTGTVAVYLSQVEMGGPDDFRARCAFLTWAARYR